MRKRWLLVPLFVVPVITAAQAPSPRIGLFAGLNQAHVDGSSVSDISNRNGGAFGLYYGLPLGSPDWSLQTGLVSTAKGWRREEPGTRDVALVRMNYLELPVLLRGELAANQSMGGFVYGGAGLAFRSGSCSLSGTNHATGATLSASCADVERAGGLKFETFDVGAILGAGARVNLGRQRLVVTAQYEHGLRNVQTDHDIKNRVLTYGAGFEVPIGRK